MSVKDFKRGVSAAIKANTTFMHKQAEATAELGKRIVQKIDEQGKIIDVILDTLNDQEKKELYELQSEYDIADLGQNEKEVLASYMLTLIAKYGQDTEEQKDFYFAVKKHLEVTDVSDDLNLALVENVDSRSELKAMFKTICEFLFLKTGNTTFLDTFENEIEYFGLTAKAIQEIVSPIEKVYNILGLRGIVEHYIPVEQTEIEQVKESEDFLVLDWDADKDFCLQNGIEIVKSVIGETEEIVIKSSMKNAVFRNFTSLRTSYRDSISFDNCHFENCETVHIVAAIIQNCTFEKCEQVSIDDYFGDKGHVYVMDCIFENVISIFFAKVKVSKSYFKNIECGSKGSDEIFSLEDVTIEDSIFENISLKNEAFLFNAFGCCEIVNSTFINIFTDRVDMMLSNYEKEDGWGFLKTSYQGELIDKNTCTGLDMINVIKGKI